MSIIEKRIVTGVVTKAHIKGRIPFSEEISLPGKELERRRRFSGIYQVQLGFGEDRQHISGIWASKKDLRYGHPVRGDRVSVVLTSARIGGFEIPLLARLA